MLENHQMQQDLAYHKDPSVIAYRKWRREEDKRQQQEEQRLEAKRQKRYGK